MGRPSRLGWIAVAANCAAALALLWVGRSQAGGWAFPLDDTYIHMAVARNLVETGTWGVNPGEFAAASSSVGWTLLLAAGFALGGVREWLPLAANLVALTCALLYLDRWFTDLEAGPTRRATGLALVSLGAALPVVAALGMEHVLHLLVAIAFARAVVEGAGPGRLVAMAALLPLIRYEGLFEIAAGATVLAWAGRRRDAVLVVAAGGAVVAGLGAWGHLHGAGLLPNSLLMKSALGTGLVTNLTTNLRDGGAAIALVAVVAVLLPSTTGAVQRHGVLFLVTALLHLGLASVGWYYRYEAYVLAWGLAWLTLAVSAPRVLPARLLAGVGGALLAWAFGTRTFDAVRYFPSRCVYIRDVKVVLAESLSRTAPNVGIALHDIGAMALYGGARIVDVAGLGTDEVARLASERRFTGQTIAELVDRRGATLGLATRSWMEADRPEGWEPVAQLEWGLDADRRIEPIVVYALAPGAEEIGRAWLADAVRDMGGRGTVGEVTQGTGKR